MKEKILAAITAGVLTTALMTGTVFAADTEVQGDKELKGEVYAFIAASLSNSMEEIPDPNEYHGVKIRNETLSDKETITPWQN